MYYAQHSTWTQNNLLETQNNVQCMTATHNKMYASRQPPRAAASEAWPTHHNQLHAWLCLLIALLLALIPVLISIITLVPVITTTLQGTTQMLCQYRVQALRCEHAAFVLALPT